jgi:tripartite-type tricarboxylate transporter receptor subunit TctC
MMFADSINAIPRIKSKELVAIAVASDKRIASIADVPTFAESGLPNIVSGPMFGLYAPAGTPTEILNKLHSEIQMILKIPTVSKTLKDLGVETRGYSPEESMRVLRAESVRTRDAIKATGIQVNQ